MFKRSKLGLRLARQSLAIFRSDFRLLIYPIIGRGCYLLVVASVSIWFWHLQKLRINLNSLSNFSIVKFYTVIILLLFACNLIAIFMSAAFSVAIAEFHAGLKPTIKEGLRAAKIRWLTLFIWICIKVTLGSLMLFLGNTLNEYKSIRKMTHGLRWDTATYFIVPSIMYHPGHAVKALQESSHMMLNYAGQKARVYYSLTLVIVSLRLMAFLPAAIALHYHELTVAAVVSMISVVLLTIVSILNTSVNSVVHSALFQFIKTNRVPEGFKKKDLEQAIQK